MRAEVDDYVDTKLANFEVVLDKTLSAVQRGREKLRGRTAHEDLAGDRDRPLEPHPFDTETARADRCDRPPAAARISARWRRSGSLARGPDQGAEYIVPE